MEEIDEIITPDYVKEFSKSFCKIKIGNCFGTGFFMKTKVKIIRKQKIHLLVTNHHVISNDEINSKQKIEIYMEHIEEKREIQLDKEKRIIKCFPKPVDITIIEILETDNLKNKIKYLKREYFDKRGYDRYHSSDIIIFHHPKGEDGITSRGKIIGINDYKFYHDAFTNNGSSGSAIILADEFKIIGIHCAKNKKDNTNLGIFIGKLFDELNVDPITLDKGDARLFSNNNLGLEPSTNNIQIISLRYKINNTRQTVRIFGDFFVRKNKNNCQIVVENKIYELCNKINRSKMKKIGNEYEIKLEIHQTLTDLSYMFCQCNSLFNP